MSRPYGPIQLTAGTMASVDVDAGAAFCVIENSCINIDLAVSFQVNSPAQATYVAGFPWDGYIQAGGSKRLTLPPNDGRWTGRIWLYPISVATSSAASGTVSSYSRAIVTTFGSREEPQDFQGVIRGLDLTSQPRVISVPMGEGQWYHGSGTLGANANDIATLSMSAIQLTAANITNNATNLYIFAMIADIDTVGSVYVSFQAQYRDATHTNVGSPFDLLKFTMSRAGFFGPSEGYRFAHPTPLVYNNLSLPANASEISFQFQTLAGPYATFGGQRVTLRLHATLDRTNKDYPAEYGNWTLHSGSGAVF